jgi:branched-chain amino acid transport system permease protein
MVIIGGLGSIYGSLLGAVLLTLLPELLRAFQDYDIVIYGLLLITMTMYMPGGLVKGIPAGIALLLPGKQRRGENA